MFSDWASNPQKFKNIVDVVSQTTGLRKLQKIRVSQRSINNKEIDDIK